MNSKIIYTLIVIFICFVYQAKSETLLSPGDSTLTYVGCFGDGYSQIVNGTLYDENLPTGLETIPGGSYTGADSLVTIDLVFNPTSTGTESYVGCTGDNYSTIVNGIYYDESNPNGTETIIGGSYLGCDSIITVDLVFNPTSTGTESYIGQVGDGYATTVNGTYYDESNPTGTEVMQNYLGCDSTVTINLVYNPTASNLIEYVGCPGDGYSTVVNGTTYDESNPTGVETINGGSYLGTDSVITVSLVFNSSGTEYYTGCTGDGYSATVNGTIYDESNPNGTETIIGGSYLGCDSIVTIDLVFNPSSTGTEIWPNGCIGDGYDITVNGTYYGESNPTGTEILTNYLGCDSIVTINLTYNTNSPSTESYTGCSGDGYSIVVNGTTYDESNPTGYEYLTTYEGCDSSITVNLTFLPITTFDYNETQCPGSGFSYTVGSDTYDETNPTGTTIISNQFGCDSIVNVNLSFSGLDIDITPSNPTLDCNGSGVSIISIPNNGQAPYTYAWSNSSTNISTIINTIGTYTVTITDTNGCSGTESVIVADPNPIIPNYTVNNVSCNGLNDGSINMAASGGTPPHIYDWSNGLTSGLASNLSANVYTVTITDAVGCTVEETIPITEPSLLSITINVVQDPSCISYGIISALANGGNGPYDYYWSDGIAGPTNSSILYGSYIVYVDDANGCSTQSNISFEAPTTLGNETYTGCEGDNYNVTVNGITYNETNPNGTEVIPNGTVDGCDSTILVNLEFLPSSSSLETYTGVEGDGYSILVNGVVYDESNPTGTETLTNFNGCDSIVNIQLNFYPSATNFIDYTGCPGDGYSVTANGVIYDESNPSGTETILGGSYLGTDSVIVVNLVFAPSFTLNINAVPPDISCEVQESVLTANVTNGTAPFSYLWNGPLFQTTQSIIVDTGGTYTVTVTDNSGCSNTSEIIITENTSDSCVFPGDANYDFVVNSMDHLTVCLAGGDTGIARNTQGISFLPHLAQDWNQQALAGVDNKHLDCDGNGTIQSADLAAVNQNYNSMHDGVNPLRTDGAPSVRLVFDEHFDIDAQNNIIVGTIVLDNPDTQGDIIDLYGILFSIAYDNTIIEDNSIVINYLDNSWIGNNAEVETLYKDFPASSQMDLAFTRGDQVSVSGSGVIAEIQFVIEDNLIGMTSDHTLSLEVTNVYAHNNLAAPIAFNAEGDVIDISIVSANHNLLSEDLINVFPNPTKNHLTIDINDLTGVSYLLYNALGQEVSNGSITSNITTINTSKLSTGIYFLNVQTEEGMINVKVLVE